MINFSIKMLSNHHKLEYVNVFYELKLGKLLNLNIKYI
jgi:hypothetical protein